MIVKHIELRGLCDRLLSIIWSILTTWLNIVRMVLLDNMDNIYPTISSKSAMEKYVIWSF